MGLDNFASRTPDGPTLTDEDEAAFASAGIEVCGGIFSDGVTSIRGKIYSDLILEVTGESLYQEWLPPEVVRAMALALATHTPVELADTNDVVRVGRSHLSSSEEMADLQRFFAICAERGLGIMGWW